MGVFGNGDIVINIIVECFNTLRTVFHQRVHHPDDKFAKVWGDIREAAECQL